MDHGHKFHLHVYDEEVGRNAPEGTVIKDAREILPEEAVFRNKGGSLGGFSDWFRYALLAQKGGAWTDMDTVCLRPLSFDSDIAFFHIHTCITTTTLIFPKGHDAMKAMEHACRHHNEEMPWDSAKDRRIKRLRSFLKQRKKDLPHGWPGGPLIFDKAMKYLGLAKYAKPARHFMPSSHNFWKHLFSPSSSESLNHYRDQGTHIVHFHNEAMSWHTQHHFKNATFDEDSLFEQLKRKHNVPNDPAATADQITSAQLSQMARARYEFGRIKGLLRYALGR